MNLRLIKNQKGFTLIEVISVVLISTILIAVSFAGIMAFFKSYNQINSYLDMQQGMMECMQMIRYGLRMPVRNANLETLENYNPRRGVFWGVTNAKTIEILNYNTFLQFGDGLKITPSYLEAVSQGNDHLRFYLDRGAIRATYVYKGSSSSSPLYIFPREKDKDKIEVTAFKISNENKGAYFRLLEDDPISLIGVEIEARVLIKDDPVPYKREYRTVNYKTTIAKKFYSL